MQIQWENYLICGTELFKEFHWQGAVLGEAEFNIQEYLRTIPTSSGVYIMKDADETHLYIGKAKNLRNRIRSYFRPSGLSHRIQTVMRQVGSIETIVTKSETEALLLENNLIKQNKPFYNISLKDDKSYPYIRLHDSHEFPKLSFYRGNRQHPGRYFGPFSSAAAVRETLSQLQKVFPIRQCRDSFYRHRSRPCLQYQIDRCTAPCVGLVEREAYMEDVEQVVYFLTGKSQDLNNSLMEKMEASAAALEFEQAAKYRDRISAIQRLREMQSVDGGSTDFDVIAAVQMNGILCIQLVVFRSGRNIDYKTLFPKIKVEVNVEEALGEFIPRYYLGREVPSVILVNHLVTDREVIAEVLREQSGRRITIRNPIRGNKLRLIELAKNNALNAIQQRQNQQDALQHRISSLAESLHLADVPERIECFDISHLAGEKTVASCVVFERNGPVKSEYRSMNISNVGVADDYAALRQAVARRYRKVKDGNGKLPDLIMIDGGKGQLNAVFEVMDELQIADVRLLAISKGKERKAGDEKIWMVDSQAPVEVLPDALLHLQHIRDEAHRFAITGHRGRRSKSRNQSVLEMIPGVGSKRRSSLLKHFGGMQGLHRASAEDISQVPGISASLAERIYFELH